MKSPEKLSTQDAEDVTVNPVSEKVDHLLWSGAVLKPIHFIGRISEIIKRLPEDLKIVRVRQVCISYVCKLSCVLFVEAYIFRWTCMSPLICYSNP